MISLPHGASRSEFAVTPKNWNTPKASLDITWRIHYRYYYKGQSRQVTIKGMNPIKNLRERQQAVKILLERERQLIDDELYNPITDEYMVQPQTGEVGPDTKFIQALRIAHGMLKVSPAMSLDIKSILKYIGKAAGKLEDTLIGRTYSDLKIGQVKRRHLVYILEQCRKDNPKMTNYRTNKYRTSLIMLFKKLIEVEAIESNPAAGLPIEKHVFKKRKLLTEAEFVIINHNLKELNYHYWRYFRIFFRSGSRSTELLTLKNDRNIDLEKQEFTIVVRKGRHPKEDTRPIPNDVIKLWAEVIGETEPGEYLFGSDFKPGPVALRSEHVNRKWRKWVKRKMGIDKDFYGLKHLNADLIAKKMGLRYAAAGTGLDPRTTKTHYTVNERQREIDELKKVELGF